MTSDSDNYGTSKDISELLEEIKPYHQPSHVVNTSTEGLWTLSSMMFGHTKPLGGEERAILSEVMYASASDTPDIAGM